jgi:hypothetical protein
MSKYKFNTDCAFWEQMADGEKVISVNGKPMPMAYYNLIVSIRDVKLYAVGMKPHRFWKITDVKKYFGIKGDASKMKGQLELIKEYLNQKTEQ